MSERELKHELRQSLAVIALTGAVLERRPARDPGVHRWVEQLRLEAEWMDRLLRGAEEGDAVLIDAGTVVSLVWESISARSQVAMRLTRGSGAWVRAVPVALERCVRHVLVRAVRAAGPHGEVLVEVTRCAGSVALEVIDSGAAPGRGPGRPLPALRAVSRFAADHGGALDVSAVPFGGTRVRLLLPGASAEELEDTGEIA